MSLNKEAALIANNLNQPTNHELKERIKDLFKSEIALVINKIANRGYDAQFIIGYDAELEKVNEYIDPINKKGDKGYIIRTKYKVPKTVRIKTDNPFVFVGSVDKRISLPNRNPYEASIMALYSSIGNLTSYHLYNDYIIINDNHNKFKGKYLHIEGIFENPEEVLSMYKDEDGHDIELPIPLDTRAMIRRNILNQLGAIPIEDENVKSEE